MFKHCDNGTLFIVHPAGRETGYVVNTAGEHPTFVLVIVSDALADNEDEHPSEMAENPPTEMATVGGFAMHAGLGDGVRVTETDDDALVEGVRDAVTEVLGERDAEAPHSATTEIVEFTTGTGIEVAEVEATVSTRL
jgi:hypothetical protein